MSKKRAIFFLVTSAFLWGVSFPIVKVAVSRISPFDLFFLRFAFAALFMIPFIGKNFAKGHLILLGFLNSSAFLMEFFGQKYTSATEAALITVTILPLVALISIFIGEKANFKTSIAVFLTVTGAFIIITRLDFTNLRFSSIKGNLLVFLATFLWAVFTVISRKIQRDGSEQTTWAILFWTGMFALPVAGFRHIELTFYSVTVSLILAVFCTIVAFHLFLEAMRKIDATTSEVIITLQLPFAIITSMIFLNEKLSLSMIIGGVLITSAIFMVAGEEE